MDACLPLRFLTTDFYISMLLLCADRIENSFPSIVACIRVYRTVAWQLVDQMRYNIL
jgi:hypothetical protein